MTFKYVFSSCYYSQQSTTKIYVLKVFPGSANNSIGHPGLEVSAETLDDLQLWKEAIDDASTKATTMAKKEVMRERERGKKRGRERKKKHIYLFLVLFIFIA